MSVWKETVHSAVVNTVTEFIEVRSFQNGVKITESANCFT